MNGYGGYLFMFDEELRADLLMHLAGEGKTFTDVMSAPDSDLRSVDVALILFPQDEIYYAALVRRGRRVATSKIQVAFSNFVAIPPIALREIEQEMTGGLFQHVIRASMGRGGRIPPGTWSRLISAVKRLRPEVETNLDYLDSLRSGEGRHFTGPGAEVMAEEKDAVGLALEIFGADRRGILSQWRLPSTDEPAPFLQGLDAVEVREDTMIAHDRGVFGDSEMVASHQVGSAEFRKNGEKLTIMNVNRTSIEHTLGVDLLYYHHRFRSYVIVQYKRMTREEGKPIYRPDDSYEEELGRMREFESAYPDTSDGVGTVEYRLHAKAFYFKLCPSTVFEPLSGKLIKGMYLPLDYWELLLKAANMRGPRGGLRITYDNVGRYVTNSLFVKLVENGWIGSRLRTSTAVTDIVSQSLQRGRSLVLAAAT